MSEFTKLLIVSPLPDGKKWVLRDEFSYDIGYKGSGNTITVPKGFVTDFASVPRVFWNIYPRWGKYGNAAVIHDYLYWEQIFSRKKSDDIFLEGMEVLGVSYFDRKIIYNIVRLFSWISWKNNRKYREEGKSKIIDLSELENYRN